jgi:hypothetical protein
MRDKQLATPFFYGIMVVFVVVTLLTLWSPANAAQNRIQIQSTPVAQQTTPTPTATAIEISEQVIQEGKPVGIIVGAVGLVVIILLSTLIFLPKRGRRSE